jgi:hypothetical protein
MLGQALYDLQMQVTQLQTLQEETQMELSALMPSVLDRAFKGDLY